MIFCEEFGPEIFKCENDMQRNYEKGKSFSINCVDLERKVNHTICRVIDDTILII